MKSMLLTFCCCVAFITITNAQAVTPKTDTEKTVLDNDKVKVTEFTSAPQGNVCGKEAHHHGPHLTVLLTDAAVEVTLPDGKKQVQKAPAGTTFWSEAETHTVKNAGNSTMRVQIIELKN